MNGLLGWQTGCEKEYVVTVDRRVSDTDLVRLRKGYSCYKNNTNCNDSHR